MFTYLHLYPIPPFFPSLISLMVSVDVKRHVYLLTHVLHKNDTEVELEQQDIRMVFRKTQ